MASNHKILTVVQTIGRSFFLPISILPVAGLLLGIGASFSNPDTLQQYGLQGLMGEGTFLNHMFLLMSAVGEAVFNNLPLLFALAVSLGMAKEEKAVAVLSAALSFIVMHKTISQLLLFSGQLLPDGQPAPDVISGTITQVLGIQTLEMGVFGGIIVGLVVAVLHNRFYKIQMPPVFSFFGGVRFIPIICTLASIVLGVVCYFAWPPVQRLILLSGALVVKTGLAGTFIFGFIERALIPFGLHHVFYMPFWQSAIGGVLNVDGTLYYGAQNIFFAQLASPSTKHFAIETARFLSGEYPIMLGGLLGAALAMYNTAKTAKRKVVGGLLFSAALTCFITGITEPIEFTFLFVAPLLYVAHCFLAGLGFVLMHVFKITIGTTFSCGLIDFTLYGVMPGNAKTNWMILVPICIIYFALYYYLFRWAILKWNLQTPGREEDEQQETKLYTKADFKAKQAQQAQAAAATAQGGFEYDEQMENIITGLGGLDNMENPECCATRLRLNVKDSSKLDKALLKKTGAMGTIINGNAIQVVYGPVVSVIKPKLQNYMDKKRAAGK